MNSENRSFNLKAEATYIKLYNELLSDLEQKNSAYICLTYPGLKSEEIKILQERFKLLQQEPKLIRHGVYLDLHPIKDELHVEVGVGI